MRCPARFAFLLEYPLRQRLLRLPQLVEGLPLASGARVLDLVALREVRRVLRPGGVLAIAEHLPDFHFRPLDRLRALLQPLGFSESGVRGSRWSYVVSFTKPVLAEA